MNWELFRSGLPEIIQRRIRLSGERAIVPVGVPSDLLENKAPNRDVETMTPLMAMHVVSLSKKEG